MGLSAAVAQARRWENEDHLWREMRLQEARDGRLWITSGSDRMADILCMALEGLGATSPITIIIDCEGGEARSFEPCKTLLRRRRAGQATFGVVTGRAFSVGLSYLVVCTARTAVPDARFLLHGEGRRWGPKTRSEADGHECYLEDHYVADWLARFTKRSYKEWLAMIEGAEQTEFGVAEALDWGVIDEVLEGV